MTKPRRPLPWEDPAGRRRAGRPGETGARDEDGLVPRGGDDGLPGPEDGEVEARVPPAEGIRSPEPLVLGVTGASGAIYAARLLRALLLAGVPVDLIFTEYGLYLLKLELGLRTATASNLDALRTHLDVPDDRWELVRVFRNHDLAADPASGSTRFRGVVVCPCSMKNVAAIAQGLSATLLQRAADVALKERRPLVLVPRETPLHLIHLENLARIARAGGTIIPAMPAFYQNPTSFEDLADFVAQRVLDHVGVEARLVPAWSEREGRGRSEAAAPDGDGTEAPGPKSGTAGTGGSLGARTGGRRAGTERDGDDAG